MRGPHPRERKKNKERKRADKRQPHRRVVNIRTWYKKMLVHQRGIRQRVQGKKVRPMRRPQKKYRRKKNSNDADKRTERTRRLGRVAHAKRRCNRQRQTGFFFLVGSFSARCHRSRSGPE